MKTLLSRSRLRWWGLLSGVGLVIFAGLQFIRPKLDNPPVQAEIQAPAAVKEILRTACYNCHSNETKLAWFDEIVPAYWLVSKHVNEGRKDLNFSEIGAKPVAQQEAILFEAFNQIQLGAMPPVSYRLPHPEARLSAAQLQTLRSYLVSVELQHKPGPQKSTAEEHLSQQTKAGSGVLVRNVAPAPNGITLPVGYENWRAISSTDREDNHTLREVLGNDVAIKAIAEGKTNPWPDGTTFAKVAWDQVSGSDGEIHAGDFKQVEFMIKDSRRYAATAGWGWARWLGADLHPFGNDDHFAESCVRCHKPMAGNDFVFTEPIRTHL